MHSVCLKWGIIRLKVGRVRLRDALVLLKVYSFLLLTLKSVDGYLLQLLWLGGLINLGENLATSHAKLGLGSGVGLDIFIVELDVELFAVDTLLGRLGKARESWEFHKVNPGVKGLENFVNRCWEVTIEKTKNVLLLFVLLACHSLVKESLWLLSVTAN